MPISNTPTTASAKAIASVRKPGIVFCLMSAHWKQLNDEERKLLADRVESLYSGNAPSLFSNIPDLVEQLALQFYKELRNKFKKQVDAISTEHQNQKQDFERVDLKSMQHDEVREARAEWFCLSSDKRAWYCRAFKRQGMEHGDH